MSPQFVRDKSLHFWYSSYALRGQLYSELEQHPLRPLVSIIWNPTWPRTRGDHQSFHFHVPERVGVHRLHAALHTNITCLLSNYVYLCMFGCFSMIIVQFSHVPVEQIPGFFRFFANLFLPVGRIFLGENRHKYTQLEDSSINSVTLTITGPCYGGVFGVYSRGLGSPNHQ